MQGSGTITDESTERVATTAVASRSSSVTTRARSPAALARGHGERCLAAPGLDQQVSARRQPLRRARRDPPVQVDPVGAAVERHPRLVVARLGGIVAIASVGTYGALATSTSTRPAQVVRQGVVQVALVDPPGGRFAPRAAPRPPGRRRRRAASVPGTRRRSPRPPPPTRSTGPPLDGIVRDVRLHIASIRQPFRPGLSPREVDQQGGPGAGDEDAGGHARPAARRTPPSPRGARAVRRQSPREEGLEVAGGEGGGPEQRGLLLGVHAAGRRAAGPPSGRGRRRVSVAGSVAAAGATPASGGRGRPRRWRARSTGRSSSGGTGWARCRRRRCGTAPRGTRRAGVGPRSQTSVARPSSDSPISSSATDAASVATWRCRSSPSWSEIRGVIGVAFHQLVEAVDDAAGVVDVGGLEDRAQLAHEPPQHRGVTVAAPLVQPGPAGELAHQVVALGELGVQQAAAASAYRMKSTPRVYGGAQPLTGAAPS